MHMCVYVRKGSKFDERDKSDGLLINRGLPTINA